MGHFFKHLKGMLLKLVLDQLQLNSNISLRVVEEGLAILAKPSILT